MPAHRCGRSIRQCRRPGWPVPRRCGAMHGNPADADDVTAPGTAATARAQAAVSAAPRRRPASTTTAAPATAATKRLRVRNRRRAGRTPGGYSVIRNRGVTADYKSSLEVTDCGAVQGDTRHIAMPFVTSVNRESRTNPMNKRWLIIARLGSDGVTPSDRNDPAGRQANGGHWQFRLRCCLSTSQFLPHGASWTWPRGGGWGGGASCCGGGASGGGAGASGGGAGASGCGAGAAGRRGGDSGCSARGGGAATGGATGFTVGVGICGSGVISPTGAGLINAVSAAPCAPDSDRPCP
jgi:hypothetical protein